MSWNYSYTPDIWPSVLTVLFLLVLFGYSWHRRRVPGALPFAIGCLLTMPLAFGKIMSYSAGDIEGRIFWMMFENAWQLPATTAITCFILEYTWPGRWLTRRNLILLSVVPVLALIYLHINAMQQNVIVASPPDGFVIQVYDPIRWIFIAYNFALVAVNLTAFIWLFIHSPQHRWPVVIMVAAQIGARALFLLEPILVDSWLYYVPEFVPVFLAYAVTLFGFRIFDPIPLARQTVIEQTVVGMLVLDYRGRIASLNPAAERIFHIPAGSAKGRPVRDLLPSYPDPLPADPAGIEIELDLGSGQEIRHHTLTISLLKDWRGQEVGRLLLLRDVTEQKLAQVQIIEQQRALAALNEREYMAHELHDSLGQVLGYVGFQVEAAAKLSRDGRGEIAALQLDRLGGIIRDAHADVREYILNLHNTPSEMEPFSTLVSRYLEGFTGNYDIRTNLDMDPGLDGKLIAPQVQAQVFRILQEALANVRKHAHAHHVQVVFSLEDDRLCLVVQDDGRGFVVDNKQAAGGLHFGLQFMRERAGQLGGSLQIQSAPGIGTRVMLKVPGKEWMGLSDRCRNVSKVTG